MITFAFQLKSQPQMAWFRHFLLLFVVCAGGCQDSGNSDGSPSAVGAQNGVPGPAGIIASMDVSDAGNLPADGQRLGGTAMLPLEQRRLRNTSMMPGHVGTDVAAISGVPGEGLLQQLQAPSVSPEIRETIQRIQLLRGTEIQATGASELEVRRRRNFRIIDLATRTLPVAMSSKGDEGVFLQLIRFLLEARLELAVSGNADDIQSLYADVKALTQRDPDSKAAAEGVYTLARFAHEMARRNGEVEPVWFDNFCQWAREFAIRFPDQKRRATALLLGSARSCELQALELEGAEEAAKLMSLATQNYRQLVSDFSDSAEATEATAVLRRLSLPGQKLSQFSGQTLDSQTIDARSFVDIVTVVYFWDARDSEFREKLLPLLQQASEVAQGRLRFVGVSLSGNQFEFSEFLQRHHVPGVQIFGTDPDHRGWDHPLVRFWGVSRGATCWLIDRDRTVAAVDVTANELVDQMRVLFPTSEIETGK